MVSSKCINFMCLQQFDDILEMPDFVDENRITCTKGKV